VRERTTIVLDHAVVGIDHSPATDRLVEELERLPRLGVRRLTLVTVLGGPYPQAPEERHREHFVQRLREVAEKLPGDATSVEVRSGQPAAELDRAAAATGADLVVAGSHGHTPWRDLFLGSTVLDLLRTSRRPILLLPLGKDGTERGGGVLLATDGSATAGAAEQLAAAMGRELGGTAVTVITRPRKAEAEEQRAAAHLEQVVGTTLTPLVRRGPLPETIATLADEQAADVIVVGARGHNPLTGLLLGSTAEHLLRTARRPVLLVPMR
jgi:nucleotide-binding universal stress UspA family protein